MKIKSGEKFKKLEIKLKIKGASNPAALAAWIGRKKYGTRKFEQLSLRGKRMKKMK